MEISDPKLRESYLRGLRLWEKKQFEEAIQQLNNTLSIDHGCLKALLLRGRVYISLEKREKAIEDFTYLLSIKKDSCEALLLRGHAYDDIEEYDLAFKDYSRIINLNRHEKITIEAHFHRGIINYQERENFGEAIHDLTAHIKKCDCQNDYKAHKYRGLSYLQINNTKLACKDFQKAIKMKPNAGYPHTLLAQCYAKQEKFLKAEREFQISLKNKPKGDKAYYERGIMYGFKMKGCEQKALADFDKCLDIDPNNIDCRSARAQIYKEVGKYVKALGDLAIVLSSDEISVDRKLEAYYFTAELHRDFLNDTEKAVEIFKKSISIDPTHPKNFRAYNDLGFIQFKEGLYKESIENLCKAEKVHPHRDCGCIYLNLGNSYNAIGQHVDAVSNYTKVLKFDKQNPKYHRARARKFRGRTYIDLEEYRKAVRDFTICIRSEKTTSGEQKDWSLRIHRAEAFANCGETKEAVDDLDHIINMQQKRKMKELRNDSYRQNLLKAYCLRANIYLIQQKHHLALKDYQHLIGIYKEKNDIINKRIAYIKGDDKKKKEESESEEEEEEESSSEEEEEEGEEEESSEEESEESEEEEEKKKEKQPIINNNKLSKEKEKNIAQGLLTQKLEERKENNKKIAAFHCLQGTLLYRLQKYDKAVKEYKESMHLKFPNTRKLYFGIAMSYYKQGKYDDCQKNLLVQKFLKKKNNNNKKEQQDIIINKENEKKDNNKIMKVFYHPGCFYNANWVREFDSTHVRLIRNPDYNWKVAMKK